jgi:hypothetical protein
MRLTHDGFDASEIQNDKLCREVEGNKDHGQVVKLPSHPLTAKTICYYMTSRYDENFYDSREVRSS